MIKIKYDDINPPCIYIKLTEKKAINIIYVTNTVHINLDESGELCSMMVLLPRDLEEETRKILRRINDD